MGTAFNQFMATVGAITLLASCTPIAPESINNDLSTPASAPPQSAADPVPTAFATSQLLNLLTAELAAQYGDDDTAVARYRREGAALNTPELLLAAQLAAERSGDVAAMQSNVQHWLQLFPDDLNAQKASIRTAAALADGARLADEALALFLRHGDLDLLLAAGAYLQHNHALYAGFSQQLNHWQQHARATEQQRLAVRLLDCQIHSRRTTKAKARRQLLGCTKQLAAASRHLRSANGAKIWRISVQLSVQLLTQLRRHFEAIALLQQSGRERPDALLAFDLARLLLNFNRARAQTALQQVLQIDPSHQQARLLRAVLLIDDNQLDKAQPLLAAIPADSRWYADAQYQLGRIADHQQHPKRALQHFRRVAPGVHFQHAMQRSAELILALQGQQPLEQWLHMQHRQHPTQREAFFLLELQLASQQRSDPLPILQRALAQLPSSAALLQRRAALLQERGRYLEAAADWRQLLAQQPDNALALSSLGSLQTIYLQKPDQGRRLLQRASQLAPDDPAVLNQIGWALYQQGDLEGALGRLLKAYALEENPLLASQLGEVYWQLKKPEKALNLWRDALQRFPTTPYVRDTIERLDVDLNGVYE